MHNNYSSQKTNRRRLKRRIKSLCDSEGSRWQEVRRKAFCFGTGEFVKVVKATIETHVHSAQLRTCQSACGAKLSRSSASTVLYIFSIVYIHTQMIETMRTRRNKRTDLRLTCTYILHCLRTATRCFFCHARLHAFALRYLRNSLQKNAVRGQ